eukprot:TRINITY_DN48621_c0_g1_i1.p1 TRINITY_DN48621_c0_g1~~TRINITY_DN48621_c0_g1_i1.p1  ORF type:complete len:269 (-),score=38.81 TRINITY_DN48621_c0_g1_i1:52-858(-)
MERLLYSESAGPGQTAYGLPPAVARIFERTERVEPLLAHRGLGKHPGSKRLSPLLAAHSSSIPTLPEPVDMESRRGRSFDALARRGADRSYYAEASDAEETQPGSVSPMPRPPPGPPGARPVRKSFVRSATLAGSVYNAPIVPGLPPVKKRPRPRGIKLRPAATTAPEAPEPVEAEAPPPRGSTEFRDDGTRVLPVQKEQRGTREMREQVTKRPTAKQAAKAQGGQEASKAADHHVVSKDCVSQALLSAVTSFVSEEDVHDCETVEEV